MKPEMSLRSRMEGAASCNPAIQPSVISSSFATSSADRSSPITSFKKAAASSRVKDSSAALSSIIWPRARSLARGRGQMDAAGDHEVRTFRQALQQEGDHSVDALGIDQVVVVEDHGDLSQEIGEFVDEDTQHR